MVPDLPGVSIILMPGDLIRQSARNYAIAWKLLPYENLVKSQACISLA
ncbi:MAG TPA: hypothetical protein VN414_04475 [Methanosarcina sp.]|nr:hypothetical protein [Methanosarcina sp.]